jgi:hypothetical protein
MAAHSWAAFASALRLPGSHAVEGSLPMERRAAVIVQVSSSIIGFIRQAAIGDPLEPFGDRVRKAIRTIESRGTWTQPQRAWLRRTAREWDRARMPK